MQQSDLVKLGETSRKRGKDIQLRKKEGGGTRREGGRKGRGSLFACLPAAAKVSATLPRKYLFSPSDLGDRDATHIISATL